MPSSSAPGVSSSERKAIEAAREKKSKEAKVKAEKRAEYMKKAAADTVEEMIDPGELESEWFKEGEWKPEWAIVEFVSCPNVSEWTRHGQSETLKASGRTTMHVWPM